MPPTTSAPELERSLAFVCAYVGNELIGFVRLAWEGSVHAFLLEPTVRPDFRRRGIGRSLVERTVAAAREHGMEWVHVDFEPHLFRFVVEDLLSLPTDRPILAEGAGFFPEVIGPILSDPRRAI